MSRRGWAAGVTPLACALLAAWAVAAPARAADAPRYLHGDHAKLRLKQDCKQCHTLDASLNAEPPLKGRNHEPCNLSGCHRAEFFKRESTFCRGCHVDPQPWNRSPGFVEPKRSTEFGSDFSHKAHIGAKVEGDASPNATCKRCHADPDGGSGKAIPGHSNCSTCHGRSAKPDMTECGVCHRLGYKKDAAKRQRNPWTVSATFKHLQHGTDPRNQDETRCSTCHGAIAKSIKASDITTPAMDSCDACHDGQRAFKTTGFACYRCHTGAAR